MKRPSKDTTRIVIHLAIMCGLFYLCWTLTWGKL